MVHPTQDYMAHDNTTYDLRTMADTHVPEKGRHTTAVDHILYMPLNQRHSVRELTIYSKWLDLAALRELSKNLSSDKASDEKVNPPKLN